MIKICGGNPGQAARSFFMSEARLASREAAGGPALQKIEAAGRPVDIDDLPGKKQIADNFGTHGFVVNFGNIHAPAGDHPRFNRKSFAGFQFEIFHRLRYPPALFFFNIIGGFFGINRGGAGNRFRQRRRQKIRQTIFDDFVGIFLKISQNLFLQLAVRNFGQKIKMDENRTVLCRFGDPAADV
jgi:hypothetical protein